MEEVNERTKLRIDFQNNVAADSNKEKDGADTDSRRESDTTVPLGLNEAIEEAG